MLCPFDFGGPCHLDTRKVFVGGDHQVGEGLVVFEVFVVTWLDVFDESVFGQQRVDFAVAFHEVDIGDLADPFGGSGFLGGGRLEVASGSRPKVFGFADVDHHPGGVFHQVDAGSLRKISDLLCGLAEAEVSCQRIVRRWRRRFLGFWNLGLVGLFRL